MKIAVEGCAHGQLDDIYSTIEVLEQQENIKVDLLICCGDFQSSRNESDLRCMAVPPKYYNMCSFYKYYSGEKVAPILTIFIGGNHEASNYLQELPYGGWVAPNIFYLGYAGIINIAGVRIGGLSGIYKDRDFFRGHFEKPPYDDSAKRSVYHIRNLEVFRLKQVSQPIDIFLSHDWPTRITNYGNKKQLVSFKPFLKNDIESEQLGSKPCEELLFHLKPNYWFSAHLHCKFAALVPHESEKVTKFLALDKCLPQRKFLQIIDIPHDENLNIEIKYDLEWLTILFLTNHLLSVKRVMNYMPGPSGNERWVFTPTEDEMSFISKKFENNFCAPNNFIKTAPAYNPNNEDKKAPISQPQPVINPQNVAFCEKLGINDPVDLLLASEDDVNNVSNISFDGSVDRTFVSDSDASSLSISKPRLSLNLPEPKNNVDDVSIEEESDIMFNTSNDFNQHIKPDVEKLDSVNEENINKNVDIVDPPVVKKFKRRNAEIYSSENDIP